MLQIEEYLTILSDTFIVIFLLLLMALYLHKSNHMRSFDENGDYDAHNAMIKIILFSLVGIMTTHFFSYEVDDFYINIVIFVATMAGIVGGPRVGLVAGAIMGIEGLLSGADPQIACAISPIIAGCIGGLIRWMAGMKYPRIRWTVIAAVSSELVHLALLEFTSSFNTMFITQNLIIVICMAIVCALVYSSIYLHYVRHKPLEW